MGLSIERNNFISLKLMYKAIVEDMVAGGFEVELAASDNGSGLPDIASAGTSIDDDTILYVLKPTASVDVLVDTQEWRFVIRLETAASQVVLNAVTPNQVLYDDDANTFAIAASGTDKESGIINELSSSKDPERYFYSRYSSNPTWSCYGVDVDVEAIPLSYRLSVTDHGFVLVTWAETKDGTGNCFNWVCIQRPVNTDGSVLIEGKAPLFCVFSKDGGGSADVNSVVPLGINKFVVRESDVNAPSESVSAVVPTADSSPIFNPAQQVSLGEDNKYILNFPKGLNTQRYTYPQLLDMICYTSADVISQYSESLITMFGEGTPRKYKAMNANHLNNKGMRLLVISGGSGIPS